MDNIILSTDSYKISHWKQYPPGTQIVRSYLESRGGRYDKVNTFGCLNYYVREKLCRPVTWEMLDEAEEVCALHFGSRNLINRDGWTHIIREHDGYLPLRVRAVPEGLLVPTGHILIGFENTDERVPWLTTYVETCFLPWFPYTVATLAYDCRTTILRALVETGTPELVEYKLHDFGYRGASSEESAAIGGSAHLVSFSGTDTLAAVMLLRKYYRCPMAGTSIPAAEHSTIVSWLREHEADAYHNMLTSFPTGVVAVVSDSYDVYHACDRIWGELLRDEVRARRGCLVIRPDSGHPPDVVLACLNILGERFGAATNHKGYRVLDEKVRIIQGDGVDPTMIGVILSAMRDAGWSADNVAFGMGGALLQKVDRDTMQFAIKCSSVRVDGVDREVCKTPVTDTGKRSKAGDLTLYEVGAQQYVTAPRAQAAQAPGRDVMEDIAVDGRMVRDEDFDSVRRRIRQYDQVATPVA